MINIFYKIIGKTKNKKIDVILHIGRSKTGSSALQRHLSATIKMLKSIDYIYPKIFRKRYNHSQLAKMFYNKEISHLSETELQTLVEWAQKKIISASVQDKTLIVSSEGFQNCNPKVIRSIFSEELFNVKIVCYFRDQASYAASGYNQQIHQLLVTPDLDTHVRTFPGDYYLFMSKWNTYFKDVIVRKYSKDSLLNQDIISDFYHHILNIENHSYESYKVNVGPSLSKRYLAFKLLYNKKYKEGILDDDIPPGVLYDALGKLSLVDDSGRFKLNREMNKCIFENHIQSNAKFFAKFMPKEKIFELQDYDKNQPYHMNEVEYNEIYQRARDFVKNSGFWIGLYLVMTAKLKGLRVLVLKIFIHK